MELCKGKSGEQLRTEEQILVQEAYEERAELRDRIVQQSQAIMDATESVREMCGCVRELSDLLDECQIELVDDTASLGAGEDDFGYAREWVVELLLEEGAIQSALLIDPNSPILREHLISRWAREPDEEALRYYAVNTRAASLNELTSSLDLKVGDGSSRQILRSLIDSKSITVGPSLNSSIAIALGLNVSAHSFELNVKGDDQEIDAIIRDREQVIMADILSSLKRASDDATLIELLLQADKNLMDAKPEIATFIRERLVARNDAESSISFAVKVPPKYQDAIGDLILNLLEEYEDSININPEPFSNGMVKRRIAEINARNFEQELIGRMQTQDPIQVLFDANIPDGYTPSERMSKVISENVAKEDLISMRLLLTPFASLGPETTSPKSNRFDMLPSPDTFTHFQRIPVKQPEEHTRPLLPSSASLLQPARAPSLSIKNDPLHSLKKMLQL